MHYHCDAQVSAKTWDAKFRYWSESMKLKKAFRQNGNERLLKTTERSLFLYHRISRSISSNRLRAK